MSTSIQCFGLDREQLEQLAVGTTVTAIVFLLLITMGECASKGWC
jgi:hypothetical protein